MDEKDRQQDYMMVAKKISDQRRLRMELDQQMLIKAPNAMTPNKTPFSRLRSFDSHSRSSRSIASSLPQVYIPDQYLLKSGKGRGYFAPTNQTPNLIN